MAAVSLLAADISTSDPKLGLDGLYTVLGLLLSVNAYNERSAFMKILEHRQQQAADDASSSSSSINNSSSSS